MQEMEISRGHLMHGDGGSWANDCAVDSTGTVHVVGQIEDTVDFGSSVLHRMVGLILIPCNNFLRRGLGKCNQCRWPRLGKP